MEFRPLIGHQLNVVDKARQSDFVAQASIRHPCICLFIAIIVFLAGLTFGFDAVAETDSGRINRVKAAFVLNIARFVSWPAEALPNRSDRILLCLYRNNPIGQAIETIHGEEIAGRQIQINQIQNLAESNLCNILLIAQGELPEYFKEAQPVLNRPLLTIADLTDANMPRILRHDILVTLVRNGSRIGFEINLDKSRRVGLRMSSELLKLAIIVDNDT